MQYRPDKNGVMLSALGYGCMRFSRRGAGIDTEKAEKEILRAYELGVNYYDTAYIYPGSEEALGTILERNGLREKVYIATKLPHYMIKSVNGMEKAFSEQLRRLKTTYIDYYLMHILSDIDTWQKLCELGVRDWLEEKKKSGLIRNIGFSYHGGTDMFIKLIDAYDWDFCQIQYNYMDEHSQAGRRGLEYAHGKGLPVMIMEPLRGGRLINQIPKSARDIIEGSGSTAAETALRWLYDQEGVTVVLSGMNSIPMVEENAEIADKTTPGSMTENERAVIDRIKGEIQKTTKVGCTGCGYCMPCPMGVDIPIAFRCYNEIYSETRKGARREYLQCTAMKKNQSSASLCVGCGKCEAHCPQHINIREKLKEARSELETPVYKAAAFGIRLLKLW